MMRNYNYDGNNFNKDIHSANGEYTRKLRNAQNISMWGAVFLFWGILIAVFAFVISYHEKAHFERCTDYSNGVIVEIICSNKKGYETRHTTYRPIVEYSVGDQTYKHRVTNAGKKSLFNLGDSMEVYYNPQNPEESYVEREVAQYKMNAVIYGCAAVTIIGAILLFVRSHQVKKQLSNRII